MAYLRKAAVALLATASALLPVSPTASATPSPLLARENFDRLPLGPVTEGRGWTSDTAGGTLTVTPASTGHGRELRIRTEGNGRAFLVFPGLRPPGNSFWARLRIRVDAFPTAPDWAHWTLAEASGAGSPTLVRPLGGQYAPTEKGNFYGVGSDLGPTGDWTSWKTSAPAAAGTWQCVEFHLDATDNRVTVYFDGVPQPDLTVSTDQHGGTPGPFVFPTFDRLKLGWQLYQADPSPSSYDVRLDDIALSTRRAGGCGA
ncbi:hypothetical protein GCM10010313_34950 [Streptomyces violarus]|uniref:LamG domain-containing protein n=1 Tax=Streptomyces violarus TaxID=67380 RepID=A0A7W4ZPD7_9ACTN|nr:MULTISPECIES: hypothetical protein [Streptomyces]MBB3076213.1 hypothetical protein [Streptomyces violarus]WRT99034.1 hypothetical protein VJ737_15625 [Streptomyces sp. CGMCC 4.1772]GHD11600.1 hypothetical protein GCM10010313_34950 [Streptomyces violarus]